MLLTKVKEQLGDIWDQVSEEDKSILEDIAKDSAKLLADAIFKGSDSFKLGQAHIQAQFANIAAPYAKKVQEAFWTQVGSILGTLTKSALKAAVL